MTLTEFLKKVDIEKDKDKEIVIDFGEDMNTMGIIVESMNDLIYIRRNDEIIEM